jgi:hypothetical protein
VAVRQNQQHLTGAHGLFSLIGQRTGCVEPKPTLDRAAAEAWL